MKDLLAELCKYDTPTICNALELIVPETRAGGYTLQAPIAAPDFWSPPEGHQSICGRACTVRIASAKPSGMAPDELKARKFAYYSHIHASARDLPVVMVVEDTDPEPRGAFWGEVHAALHRALGATGVLTNGVMRDLGDLDPEFLILAGKIGPSHAYVHWVDFAKGATVFGLDVAEGDFIHADRHGAVVIPEHALEGLPAAIAEMGDRERPTIELARRAPRLDNLDDLARVMGVKT